MRSLFDDFAERSKPRPHICQDLPVADSLPMCRPCDLPQDHPDWDPFDTGDARGGSNSGLPQDMQITRAEDMLKFVDAPAKAPKLNKDANQFRRSIADISKLYPGWYWKTEHYTTIYTGQQIKRDFAGFADLVGVTPVKVGNKTFGQIIAVQITTRDQVMPHIRKYTDPEAKSGGLGDQPIEYHLREFLRNGGIFVILGYHKPKSRWECTVTKVTEVELDAAVARKRKPKGAK